MRVLLLILGLPLLAYGEDSGDGQRQPMGQPIIIQQQSNSGSNVPYRGQQIFSDDVFKSVGKDTVSAPPVSKSVYTGTVRAMEREANYNSEQSERWRRQCKGAMAQDPKLGRECFDAKREEELGRVQAMKDSVERRQNTPYRNMQSDPISEAAGAGVGPAYQDSAAIPATE